MPISNLIIHYNILLMRGRSPEAPVCAHQSVCAFCLAVQCSCVCVCVYLGSVLLMSLKSSLKYCGTLTMTGSEEGMDRGGSALDSTTALTKPSQSNYRQTDEGTHTVKVIQQEIKKIYLKQSFVIH